MDASPKLNGYKPRSYGDIAALAVSIASLGVLFMSAVLWMLKLEARLEIVGASLNEQSNYITELKSQISRGILPRAEERINQLQRRVIELGDDFDDHDVEHTQKGR